MTTAKLSGLVRQFARPAAEAPDDELLERFAATRDEAAFAELVRRFGPLVFAVCRRVTGSHHLSEDAFQAVFVVLAAKAGSVRAAALPGFLHGVATRTALRARTVADRRRRRETPVEVLPDVSGSENPPADAADLASAVDEEVARLPAALRAAVVLCELDGWSRKDAAARLGVPEGTVSSRLAAARKVLAGRLRNRGFAPGAAALAVVLGAHARAVPAALAARAVACAVSPVVRPAAVAALSTGVLRLMFAQKLKIAVPLVALALGALACVALATDPDRASRAPSALVRADEPAPKGAPKPLPKGPNKLLFWHASKLVTVDPDGKNVKEFELKDGGYRPDGARLSPDGTAIAFRLPQVAPNDPLPGEPRTFSLHVRKTDDAGAGTDLGAECEMFAWSPDGTEIVCGHLNDKQGQQPQGTNFVVNVKSKEKTALKLPANQVVNDWAPDGRLLTMSLTGTTPENVKVRLHLMNRDGTEHKALAPDTDAALGRVSPDGTRVLFTHMTFKPETPAEKKKREDAGGSPPRPEYALSVLDVATGKVTKVQEVPDNAELQQSYCWSPDGKRIAYTWRERHEGKPEDIKDKETESHLVVSDPDGKNAKTVASEKGKTPWEITLAGVDWR